MLVRVGVRIEGVQVLVAHDIFIGDVVIREFVIGIVFSDIGRGFWDVVVAEGI